MKLGVLELHGLTFLSFSSTVRMSKELRESLVKLAKTHAEKARVGIRKTRQKGITDVKKKDDVSKDTVRRLEKHVS